jgi:flagellar M-ring protein FliF
MIRSFSAQPAVRRSLPVVGVVGSLSLAALAWWGFQAPAQQALFTGMSEIDKASVSQALQTSGISYTLDRDTGNILVAEDSIHKARMLLAAQGLPKAAPTGDAILATLPMGSSRAAEGEALRGAREADIARSIEAIDSIKAARVQLAVPEQSVFLRENQSPSASVMLTLQQGQSLSTSQVRAIRHLVASSVANMQPDNVSIVDQSGALLTQMDISADNAAFALQVQIEDHYRKAIQDLLSPVIGRDNFSTELHIDVDSTESQSTRETYPKNDAALRREEGNKSNTPVGTTSTAGGIPGALSNQPPTTPQLSTQSSNSRGTTNGVSGVGGTQSAETYARNFEVGREISVTHQPVGKIRRLSAAVIVRASKDAKRPSAADTASLEALIKGAVGYDATRGDLVVVNSRDFSSVEPAKVNFWDKPWFLTLVRELGALIVAGLVLFFVGRPALKHFKQRLNEQLAIGNGLESNPKGGILDQPVTVDMIEATPRYADRADLVRQYVKQDTDRAGKIVQNMMEDSGNG